MGVDIEKTAKWIDVVRGMSSAELAVLVSVVVVAVSSSVYVYTWVEGRYAKVVDMQDKLNQQLKVINNQQQELNQQQEKINSVADNFSSMFNSLSPELRREIEERVRAARVLSTDPNKFVPPK